MDINATSRKRVTTQVEIFVQKKDVEFSNVAVQERTTTRLGQRMTFHSVAIAHYNRPNLKMLAKTKSSN